MEKFEILHTTVSKYIGVDEELDREVQQAQAFREGTPEWEDEYPRRSIRCALRLRLQTQQRRAGLT